MGSMYSRVVVLGDICHGQMTQHQISGGRLNAAWQRDKNPLPILAPSVRQHNVTFRRDNARPPVAGFAHSFWRLKTSLLSSGLPVHQTHPRLSRRVCRHVPVPRNISELCTAGVGQRSTSLNQISHSFYMKWKWMVVTQVIQSQTLNSDPFGISMTYVGKTVEIIRNERSKCTIRYKN